MKTILKIKYTKLLRGIVDSMSLINFKENNMYILKQSNLLKNFLYDEPIDDD